LGRELGAELEQQAVLVKAPLLQGHLRGKVVFPSVADLTCRSVGEGPRDQVPLFAAVLLDKLPDQGIFLDSEFVFAAPPVHELAAVRTFHD
jgi:hypothetical protein